MRFVRWIVWLLDECLDRIPAVGFRPFHFYRYGQLGCRLRLSRCWAQDEALLSKESV